MSKTIPKERSSTQPRPRESSASILAKGRAVLQRETEALEEAAALLDERFVEAVHLLLDCSGRIAVTGMGKAGLIGAKIQATLSSTAAPAFFLHPVEALHGDLGMLRPDDVVVALSRSGETQELICLLPKLKQIGCSVVLLTAKPQSQGAQLSDVVLEIGETAEACPLGLAPSSSTAAMLALGDALALTVMGLKEVQPEHYAAYHPGGALGRSLMKVSQIMRSGADCPTLSMEGTLADYGTVVEQAPRRAGAAAIIDSAGKLRGIFTHGDLFRHMHDGLSSPSELRLSDAMTSPCKSARLDDHVASALAVMRKHRIDELPVVDDEGNLVGMIDIQDLLSAGFSAFDDQ